MTLDVTYWGSDSGGRVFDILVNGQIIATQTLTNNNPGVFGYIGVFSSGWFPDMLADEEKTDLAQYKASGRPFKLYWVGVGKYDIAKANSDASVALLKKAGIDVTTHDSGGFHAWNNWRDYLNLLAPMLFR